MDVSFPTTKPSERGLLKDGISYSLTQLPSRTFTSSGSSIPSVAPLLPSHQEAQNDQSPVLGRERHADDGMKGVVPTQLQHATTSMSVQSVEQLDTHLPSVTHLLESEIVDDHGSWDSRRPRYACDFIWSSDGCSRRPCLAACSETFAPIPSVPQNELSNLVALQTIQAHSDLFAIITPVKVDTFEGLLRTHPNQPLVSSVVCGLREGFWPFADTSDCSRPLTHDQPQRPFKDPMFYSFVKQQRDVEISEGRFSRLFGKDLLMGMHSVPLGVVPKPHSDKLCLVVDQSAGEFSNNSLIKHEDAYVVLDSLQHLGAALLRIRAVHGNTRLIVFKSDVSAAHRRLPMHRLWQILQIVTIEGERHVDCCNNFGNRSAGRLWTTFFSLVLWIAINILLLLDILAYVDDVFSWEFADNMLWYAPYEALLPRKQALLLYLWDVLGIPHEKRKQEWGYKLVIIGFEVDPNDMTITMSLESRSDLVQAIYSFAKVGLRLPLRRFRQLAGWINWALNVYPLLRPGLCILYVKMSHISQPERPWQLIWISKSLCRELVWVAQHIEISNGIHIIESLEWDASEADLAAFTDASLMAMGFCFPSSHTGYHCPIPVGSDFPIFYFEALSVLSALDHICHHLLMDRASPNTKVAIFCDNMNTVDMFNSLRAQPRYNPILLTAVDLLIQFHVQLRLFHVPGSDNSVADLISRSSSHLEASLLLPRYTVLPFIPPQLTLGAMLS
jgi:hypothetical protein